MKRLLLSTAALTTFAACTMNFDDAYNSCFDGGWCAEADAGVGGGGGGGGGDTDAGGGGVGGGVGGGGGSQLVIEQLEEAAVIGDPAVNTTLTVDGGRWDAGAGVPISVVAVLQRCGGINWAACQVVADGGYRVGNVDLDTKFRVHVKISANDEALDTYTSAVGPVVRQSPATLSFLSGFEVGEWSAHNALADPVKTLTTSIPTARSGKSSLYLQGSSAAVFRDANNSFGTANDIVGRFALYVQDIGLPGSCSNLISLTMTGGAAGLMNFCSPGQVVAGSGNTRATGPQITTNQWHIIDFAARRTGGSNVWDINWRVDALVQSPGQANAVLPDGGASINGLMIGAANANYTYFVDDFAISLNRSDYPIGDGRVYALRPNAFVGSTSGAFACHSDGGYAACTGAEDIRTNFSAQQSSVLALSDLRADTHIEQVSGAGGVESIHYEVEDPSFGGLINGLAITQVHSARSVNTNVTSRFFLDGGTPLDATSWDIGTELVARRNYYPLRTSNVPFVAADLSVLNFEWGYTQSPSNGPRLHEIIFEADVAPTR